MIQALPFYSNDKLNNLVESVDNNKIYLSTGKWSKLQNKAFSYADVIEEYTLQTECSCSKEMFFCLLTSVDTDELKESIQMNKDEELECGKYYFVFHSTQESNQFKYGLTDEFYQYLMSLMV